MTYILTNKWKSRELSRLSLMYWYCYNIWCERFSISILRKFFTELNVKIDHYGLFLSASHIADYLVVWDRTVDAFALVVWKTGRVLTYHSVGQIIFSFCGNEEWNWQNRVGYCPFHRAGDLRSLDIKVAGGESWLDEFPDCGPTPHDIAAERELMSALCSALTELPQEELALCKAVMANLSERAAAAELNITREAFTYRRNKLFARLKKILEKYL